MQIKTWSKLVIQIFLNFFQEQNSAIWQEFKPRSDLKKDKYHFEVLKIWFQTNSRLHKICGINTKGIMDRTILRFPVITEQIFDQMDDQNFTKCISAEESVKFSMMPLKVRWFI